MREARCALGARPGRRVATKTTGYARNRAGGGLLLLLPFSSGPCAAFILVAKAKAMTRCDATDWLSQAMHERCLRLRLGDTCIGKRAPEQCLEHMVVGALRRHAANALLELRCSQGIECRTTLKSLSTTDALVWRIMADITSHQRTSTQTHRHTKQQTRRHACARFF